MNKKKLSIRVLGLVFFIFLFNYLAMKFHWYSLILWLDILMHFLGGLWLGLAALLLVPKWEKSSKFLLRIFLYVLIVSVLWEVFEIILNAQTTRNPVDWGDITSDLFADLAGAAVALLYVFKRIMPREEGKI